MFVFVFDHVLVFPWENLGRLLFSSYPHVGNLFIWMKSGLLEMLNKVLTKLCLFIFTLQAYK